MARVFFQVHTTRIIQELLYHAPCIGPAGYGLKMIGGYLQGIAQRASELDDPILNSFMMLLSLYAVSNPDDKDEYKGGTFVQDYAAKHLPLNEKK